MDITSRYNDIEILGKGSVATVVKSVDIESNTYVVIKKWNHYFSSSFIEATILYLLLDTDPFHPGYNHVIHIIDHIEEEDQSRVSIVLPLYEGTLLDLIMKYPFGMPEEMVRNLGKQMCLAVSYSHFCSVFHGDIKPENFLYRTTESGQYHIVLCDFSNSRMKDNMISPPHIIQTKQYRCLESIIGYSSYTLQSDMTSIAFVIGEMALGKYVLSSISLSDTNSIEEKEEHIIAYLSLLGKNTLTEIQDIHPVISSFLEKIPNEPQLPRVFENEEWMTSMIRWLHPIPDKRWTADESLSHGPFQYGITMS